MSRACNDETRDNNHVWATGAQLPDTNSCSRTYRYLWWSIWYEFPLAVGLLAALLGWLGMSLAPTILTLYCCCLMTLMLSFGSIISSALGGWNDVLILLLLIRGDLL